MTAVADLKRTHRATWASGDYAAVAELIDDLPPRDLLAAAQITPGMDVLDVATGTGNIAIQAAAAGAQVVGLDLTPELFQTAWRRADARGVAIDWVEGDAEDLPFEDASFDRVVSAFGVQFAPRHEIVARELVRVCRPGGIVAVVSWTPSGAIGELLSIVGSHMPKPPAYASPPPLWGDEDYLRSLFGDELELSFTRGENPWAGDSVEHLVSFFETHYGPMLKAREKLTAEGRWEECRQEIVEMWSRRNEATDGSLKVSAEYLVFSGRKSA
jgi:SAM-dependent methyltransferase